MPFDEIVGLDVLSFRARGSSFARQPGMSHNWLWFIRSATGHRRHSLEQAKFEQMVFRIYELVESGEWTWEKFKEIAIAATRDLDGDGLPIFGDTRLTPILGDSLRFRTGS